MRKQDRWQAILNLCQTKEKVTTEDILHICPVSIATIRRDLQQMEDLHMIHRFHGGAMSNTQVDELPMIYKSSENASEKVKIARKAAQLIQNNQTIYLDAGSTTFEMIPYIHSKNITVVTIGIPHLSALLERNIHTIVLPGTLRKSTEAITGAKTFEYLDSFYFDLAFMGANGIHPKAQITTTNDWEAAVKEKVIQRSNKAYILADCTKFNRIYPIKFANLDDVICISDSHPIQMTYLD
ncbi:MAG: DeoR/GlpR family DNA-binding transcription regulator [Floccifex sp.]